MNLPPRTADERMRDTMRRLGEDLDAWFATAGAEGNAHLVPLCFLWHDGTVVVSTYRTSVTARNLVRGTRVRVCLGATRDVVVVEGVGEPLPEGEVSAVGEAFVAKHGWDPGREGAHGYFRIRPQRVQAWRQVDEEAGRTLMRDGRWLVEPPPGAVVR